MNENYRSSGLEADLLFSMARPDIYRINGFRVLELPVTASPREISSQLRKLNLMEKFGDISQREKGILALTPLPDGDIRSAAAHRLNDPELRLADEFFWFWPLRPGLAEDMDEATVAIKRNDFHKAVSIWNHHELEGSEANVSMHNLAIMYHALALDLEYIEARQSPSVELAKQKLGYWKEAFARWKTLLNYNQFWQRLEERVREIDDPRLTTATANGIRVGLPLVLLSINAMLAVQHASKGNKDGTMYQTCLMANSGLDKAVVDEAIRGAVGPICTRVKIMCTSAEDEINKTPLRAPQVARRVIKETSQPLSILDELLPKGHATLEATHDKVALLVLESQIRHSEGINWHKALELLEQALRIASTESACGRISESIEICRDNLASTICWFCKEHPPKDGAEAEVKMYGNVRYGGSKVYFQKTNVPVPRCKRCKSAHSWSRNSKILGGVLGPVIGFTGCTMTVDTYDFGSFFFLLAIPIGIGIGYAAGRLPKGIDPEKCKKDFPAVRKWQSEGWAVGEQPPGVS